MLVHADDRVVTVSLKMLYETKGKGEKERYTHLNAEFHTIARKDKKAFLRYQCKEIEEKNRMGKTGDLLIEIPREHFMQRWAQWTEMVWT